MGLSSRELHCQCRHYKSFLLACEDSIFLSMINKMFFGEGELQGKFKKTSACFLAHCFLCFFSWKKPTINEWINHHISESIQKNVTLLVFIGIFLYKIKSLSILITP